MDQIPPGTGLIVDGLGDKISESELRRLCEQVGVVRFIKISTRPDGSTFGLVVMGSVEEARDAILKFHGTHHRGTIMQLKLKQEDRG